MAVLSLYYHITGFRLKKYYLNVNLVQVKCIFVVGSTPVVDTVDTGVEYFTEVVASVVG